jgi:hypothetical protein
MPTLASYQKAVLHTTRLVALLVAVVSGFLGILVICDLLFRFHWGYPWWAIVFAIGGLASALTIRKMIAITLRFLP